MNPNEQPPNQQQDPIDRIVQALHQAAPPTGMDSRILAALESHTLQPSTTSPRRWLPWGPVLALTTAVAAILLILAIARVSLLRDRPTLTMPGLSEAEHSTVLNPRNGPSTALLESAPIFPVPHLRPGTIGPKVGLGEAGPSTALATHKTLSAKTMKPQPSSADLFTLVSFPAPPMPLTRQERLLLRIANGDTPQDLAALTPAARAAAQARDSAAFEDFFPAPTPVDYPTLISQSNPPAPTLPNPGASK